MPYSIPSSPKILTLPTAPFLFTLVGVLSVYEFTMASGVYIYCPFRKKRCALLPEGTDVHIQQHIHQKDLNFCLPLCYYGKVIVELEKTQLSNLTVFMVLII